MARYSWVLRRTGELPSEGQGSLDDLEGWLKDLSSPLSVDASDIVEALKKNETGRRSHFAHDSLSERWNIDCMRLA
ncbi:hypothetical protein DTW90_33055 [Neorhizobium sp. P12A]|nr:hypothetical protein DTW90_33055 [Neorhizobium sp. P12A]